MTSRIASISLVALAVIAFVPGILSLRIEQDISASLLSRKAPEVAVYERYLDLFPADYGAIVVALGEICSDESWRRLSHLTEALEALPDVDQVIGLPTAKHVTGSGDTVTVENFLDLIPELPSTLCSVALAYGPYQDLLVTDRGRAKALYVIAQKDVDAVSFTEAVEDVLNEHRPAFQSEISTVLIQSGELYVSSELSRLTTRSATFIVVVIVVMFFATWILTKSMKVSALTVTTGILTVFFTFSLMGYAGIPQSPLNALVVNMLIPLGAAFVIHAYQYVQHSVTDSARVIPAHALKPFAFATCTTMVGFGSTAISGVTDIQQVGLLGFFGIAVCLFLTLFLVFPLLPRPPAEIRTNNYTLPALLRVPLDAKRWHIVCIALTLVVLSAAGLSRLTVNYGPVDYLKVTNPVHVDFEHAGEYFGRYTIPLIVFGDEPGDALDPQLWRKVHRFVTSVEEEYPGLHGAWLYDQLSELSRAFTADDSIPLDFPDSRELIAQFLMFFDERDIEPYLDWDRQSLTVILQVPFRNSSQYRSLKAMAVEFAKSEGLDASLTGRVAGYFEVGDQIARENLQSLAIGLAVIYLLFFLLLRSFAGALIAVLVNALPVLGCLAFMGLFRMDLDIGSSIVAAIALGLVVDDTGHMLARYTAHRLDSLSPRDATQQMLCELWKPVVVTTLVICIGFSVMNLADMIPFHTFSRLLSATMIYALFGDLLLLPALLVTFDRSRNTAST